MQNQFNVGDHFFFEIPEEPHCEHIMLIGKITEVGVDHCCYTIIEGNWPRECLSFLKSSQMGADIVLGPLEELKARL
jgi:hypothetical protein